MGPGEPATGGRTHPREDIGDYLFFHNAWDGTHYYTINGGNEGRVLDFDAGVS